MVYSFRQLHWINSIHLTFFGDTLLLAEIIIHILHTFPEHWTDAT